MTSSLQADHVPGRPGPRFEPYVRLVRALLPRTSCVAMFGPGGELVWSTDFGIDRFGASGKGAEVLAHFGFTAEHVSREVAELLKSAG